MQLLHSALFFVIAIGVLVTVHEFGHFWVARRLGVKVLRFSVGFGRPLLTRRSPASGTEYVLAAIPLGGYVKMLDEAEGDVAPSELAGAFNRKPLWVRTAVVLAGPAFNFAFAVLAYAAMFMLGVSGLRPIVGQVQAGSMAEQAGFARGQEIVAVDGRAVSTWEAVVQEVVSHSLDARTVLFTLRDPQGILGSAEVDLSLIGVDDLTQGQFFDSLGIEPDRPKVPPRIGAVLDGGAAASAGLRDGDRVLSADGEAISSWQQWVDRVRASPDRPMQIVVERAGAHVELVLTPARVVDGDQEIGRIGATVAAAEIDDARARYHALERHGPLDALALGAAKTWDMSVLTLKMLWRMLTLDVSVKNLSGPISIAQYAGVSADIGLSRFIGFLAIVSVSLGILNLLPIPLLDGGHLLYYLAEAVRGQPLSDAVQYAGQRLGIALLIGLMGLAFYNDLARVFG